MKPISTAAVLASALVMAPTAVAEDPFDSLPEPTQAALIACDVDADETNTLLALDPRAFDQDFSGGWRPIGDRGCHEAAAGLILAYIEHTDYSLSDGHVRLMRWHAGQSLGFAEDYSAAIPLLETTYQPAETADPTWNLYVEATLAFLNRDRAGLEDARDRLAVIPVSEEEQAARRQFLRDNPRIRMPRGFVTEPDNLPVVNRLLDCFDADYRSAYFGECD
ncbi:hypothetical protein [Maricaulis parjimensis]|uniref:hypothetical protein n=1 Tax=Maricaulis parjimensis TaxID=144023 RepID=UPI00193A7F30|nr:hypothetical protein [Maricaulis parjimensis]